MTALLRLLARLADALLAPPAWSFESASYSREGGESRTPTPTAVQANRPRGCTPSLAELVDFYCPPSP